MVLLAWLWLGVPSLLMSQQLQWVRQIGGTGYNDTKRTVVDSEGNIYMIGSFQGTVDVDPSAATQTLSSSSDRDIFVAKYNAEGGLVFVNQIEVRTTGNNETYAEDITLDANGNVFISASFIGDVSLGTITLSSAPAENGGNSRDILFARYNADGGLSFAYRLGGPGFNYGYALATTNDNKILLLGRFQKEVDFDPTAGQEVRQGSFNSTDIFIARYNPDGSLDEVATLGGNNFQTANSLAVDSENNIIIAGSYQNRIALNPGSSIEDFLNVGTNNGFVAKYDQNFNLQFAAPFLLPQNRVSEPLEITTFVQTDQADNVLVTGRFTDQVSISAQVLNAAGNGIDIFLAKYQPNGNLVFARQYGGMGYEEPRDVTTDAEGNIYLVGNFQNVLDLDGNLQDDNLSSQGGNDGFLAKLDAQGNYISVQQLRGNNNITPKRLVQHPTDPSALIMTGMFEGSIAFNESTSLSSQGDFDVFFARYNIAPPPPPVPVVSLATLSVYEGLPGTQVTLFGENFSATLQENVVRFGQTNAVLVSVNQAGTELTVTVPEGLVSGDYEVSVTVGEASDTADQTFSVPEEIVLALASLSASEGRPGDQITLIGSGFSPEATVTFGSEVLTPDVVNGEGTAITITVPDREPGSYPVAVSVGEATTSSLTFQINEPDVLNLQTLSIYVGQIGDEVVLRGENFGEAIENTTVTFGETVAEVLSINQERTELTVRVPEVALGSYPVAVRVGEASDTADQDFLVDSYCASSAQDDQGIRIEQVRLEQIDNRTVDGCSAYANYTGQTASLVIGSTVPLSVTVGSCTQDEPKAVSVFIDWNGDQDFEDEGETVATSATLTGATTFDTQVTVPPDAPADLVTRLRVVLFSVSDIVPLTDIRPCGVYAAGETQDYSVQFVNSPPPVITAVSPMILEANVTGTFVISGENFGDAADSITVTLGDTPIAATDIQVNGTGTQITVTVPPLSAGEYSVQVTISDKTVAAPTRITVTDEPVADQLPPTIVVNAPATLNEEDATFAISSEVTDPSGVATATLEFLPIRMNPRSDDWRRITASREGTTNTYIAQLNDTDLDELGVQTRLIATDPLGNTDTSAIRYTYRNYTTDQPLPIGRLSSAAAQPTANDYNLLAIPLQNQSVTQALGELGEYNTRRWRAWQLRGNGQGEEPYQEFGQGWPGDIQPGQGYLLIYTEETDFQTTGQVVEATYDQPYTITLQPGCNLIGNPYNFALDWPAVLAFNNQDAELLRLKVFNDGFREASRLDAFQGGLVINPNEGQPITLALPVNVSNLPNGRSTGVAQQKPSTPGWEVALTLSSGALTAQGSVGMRPDAQPGFDRHDDFTPPRLTGFPELTSYHPEFFLPKFSHDIVPVALQHVWQWEVVTHQPHQEVTLRWEPKGLDKVSQTLTLVDEQQVRAVDMRQQSHYTFRVSQAGTYSLQVVYGSPDEAGVAATQVQVGQVYPNPATDRIHLPVRLPDGGLQDATLEVFDATGRLVDRQEYHLRPGYHTLLWQRSKATLRATPAGLYLYRLRFENAGRIVSGRVLLK